MKWLEYGLLTDNAAVEAAAELLQHYSRGGVVIDDPHLVNRYRAEGLWDYSDLPDALPDTPIQVKCYLPVDDRLEGTLLQLAEAVKKHLMTSFPEVRILPAAQIDEQDWATAWKNYFHVLKVGNGMVVKPTWEAYTALPGEHIIEIDPGMAFGTGTHATTKMCIEFLEEVGVADKIVYDVGTGSGILAIAAALLGAQRVSAVDIDAVAVRIARENVELNALAERISVHEGDLLSGFVGKCDIMVANIIADVIIAMLPDVALRLNDNGVVIFSGIIDERVDDVLCAVERAGLRCRASRKSDVWCALLVSA